MWGKRGDGGAGSDQLSGGIGNDILISDLKTKNATSATLSGDTGLGKVEGGDGFDTFVDFLNSNGWIKGATPVTESVNGASRNHFRRKR